ncbi:hypothetical protein FA13DRAFT_1797477 [Coprinellus micaceus]|uniref:Uncharacterized protein n=1 Tax=Coprinellus micaceus TaxID=71717 RepID=A0A4Y7SR29_COPMI|nr:hypothetical protein FA13DRAFT_1797477 [Coprinellus micaceus]
MEDDSEGIPPPTMDGRTRAGKGQRQGEKKKNPVRRAMSRFGGNVKKVFSSRAKWKVAAGNTITGEMAAGASVEETPDAFRQCAEEDLTRCAMSSEEVKDATMDVEDIDTTSLLPRVSAEASLNAVGRSLEAEVVDLCRTMEGRPNRLLVDEEEEYVRLGVWNEGTAETAKPTDEGRTSHPPRVSLKTTESIHSAPATTPEAHPESPAPNRQGEPRSRASRRRRVSSNTSNSSDVEPIPSTLHSSSAASPYPSEALDVLRNAHGVRVKNLKIVQRAGNVERRVEVNLNAPLVSVVIGSSFPAILV